MTDKSKGGRPPAPPGLRRVNVPLRLPEWLAVNSGVHPVAEVVQGAVFVPPQTATPQSAAALLVRSNFHRLPLRSPA